MCKATAGTMSTVLWGQYFWPFIYLVCHSHSLKFHLQANTVRGGDIHVGVDGNMHHKRSALVGSTPEFYHPVFFVDKTFVDQVDAHLQWARGQGARTAATQLPQKVVDACTDSYKAAHGDDIKVQSPDFAERGLFVMVCRHDIPLMLCNIDTPGEQQKYVFAFIFILFGLLPAIANVVLFYDIACIVDNSRTIVGSFLI